MKEKAQPVNKEAFKMLAIEIGLNAACRRMGIPISTGKSWRRRGGWDLGPRHPGGRPGLTLPASTLHPVADALENVHKIAATRTRTALAQAATAAAEAAAAREQPLPVQSTAQLRELTAAASRVFGWDSDRGPSTVHNTLVITREQLAQIRALWAETTEKEILS